MILGFGMRDAVRLGIRAARFSARKEKGPAVARRPNLQSEVCNLKLRAR